MAVKFSMLYQNRLLGPRRRFIYAHVDIIGLVPKMEREFLVQTATFREEISTIVNVVGVATSTEERTGAIFDFETLHQPMLTNTLVTMKSISFSTVHLLLILLESSA